jgi:hypothetical protein
MKNIVKNKKTLALGIMLCILLLATTIPNVVGVPPDKPVKDFDWNHWQNKPHMFSLPPGNVGIGTPNPEEKLTLGPSNSFAIEMQPPTGVEATPQSSGYLSTGDYYIRIVASDGVGTTRYSEEVYCYIDSSTHQSIFLIWEPIAQATEYYVWKGSTEGGQDRYQIAYTNSHVYENDGDSTVDYDGPSKTTTAYACKIAPFGDSWLLGSKFGIGKIPEEELDVEGDVQVTGSYKYTNEKTGYLNIPACAFSQSSAIDNDHWYSNSASGYIEDGSGTYDVFLVSPVYLPDGAEITKFTAYYYDNDPDDLIDFYASIMYCGVDSTLNILISSVSKISVDSEYAQSIYDTVPNHSVDYENYHYWVYVIWEQSDIGDSLKFKGCQIEYTIDEVSI